MRHRIVLPALLLIGALASGCRDSDYAVRGSASVASGYGDGAYATFYDDLRPYGRWVEYDRYGMCWTPSHVSADWRPYTVGHWAWTDAGWLWVSEEPFGWATYHYGRWLYDEPYGWIWVPDDEWGSSWVAWRYTDDYDYVGWAPLPPTRGFFGVSFTWSSGLASRIDSDYWCFVPSGYFLDTSVRRYIVPVTQNVTYIDKSHVRVRYDSDRGGFRNVGFRDREVERWSGHPVKSMAIRETDRPRWGRTKDGTIPIYRPAAVHGRRLEPARDRDREDERIDRGRGRDDEARVDRERHERTDRERENARIERERQNERRENARIEHERNDRAERERGNARIERERENARNENARVERNRAESRRLDAEREHVARDRAEERGRQREAARIENERRNDARRDEMQRQERARLDAEQRRAERERNYASSRREAEVRSAEPKNERRNRQVEKREAERNDPPAREREERQPKENRGRKR